MKEEELHKKIKDFFNSLDINNIDIHFEPTYERDIPLGHTTPKTYYKYHTIEIKFIATLNDNQSKN